MLKSLQSCESAKDISLWKTSTCNKIFSKILSDEIPKKYEYNFNNELSSESNRSEEEGGNESELSENFKKAKKIKEKNKGFVDKDLK